MQIRYNLLCYTQEELQQEKDRNTELVADSKQLSSLKKVTTYYNTAYYTALLYTV